MEILYAIVALILFMLWLCGNPLGIIAGFICAVQLIGMATAPLHGVYASDDARIWHIAFLLGSSALIAVAPAALIGLTAQQNLVHSLHDDPRPTPWYRREDNTPSHALGWLLTHGWLLLNCVLKWWMLLGLFLFLEMRSAYSGDEDIAYVAWAILLLPFTAIFWLHSRYGVRPQKSRWITVLPAQATGYAPPPLRRFHS